jgi:hypothetical protein
MAAAKAKSMEKVIVFLLKYGANPQASAQEFGTAVNFSKRHDAPAEQITYLEAKTHCANPGCSGAGCLVVFYCGHSCQLAHWSAHKAECIESK